MILILFTLLHLATQPAAISSFKKETVISFNGFNRSRDEKSLVLIGEHTNILGGALQVTPDTSNQLQYIYNASGRILYYKPFRLWLPGQAGAVASFNSTFVINIFRNPGWDNAGEGFAFLIAPNATMPGSSHGQWLGLTNAFTNGNPANKIVAVEFDTEKQDGFDPDDNHLGLDINSVNSVKTVSLNNYNITISPDNGTDYQVWVQYSGTSNLMEVYMAKDGQSRPPTPLLNHTINLKDYVQQVSYFGFAASTGYPQIQLNCVKKWSLDLEILPEEKDLKWLRIGIGAGVAGLITVLLLVGYVIVYVKKRRRARMGEEGNELGQLRLPGMPREFRYKDLKNATNNFDESMRLGEGGFGIVYKGILHDRDQSSRSTTVTEIAVKKFSRDNIKSKLDFLAELTIIHRLRHKHLVPLVGWCYEKGKLLLVYDFMPNGSLDRHLYETSNDNILSWGHRYKILAGVASALHYLHNEYYQRVVHRDLKASNILLDTDFDARLGDFGLARALENESNSYAEHGLPGVPGTFGYVAPECFHTGKASPESDVFGFGAVVLEVVCGKSPGTKIPHHQDLYSLVDWIWMLHREGRLQDAVDQRLDANFDVDEANRLLLLGLACSHPIASERPHVQDILQIIRGTIPAPRVPPFKPIFTWPSVGIGASTAESLLSGTTFSSQDFGLTSGTVTRLQPSDNVPV